jgi:hypothetical protein
MAGKASDRHSLVRILTQHQWLLASALYQQVANRLVVDFQVRERDLGHLFILYVLNLLKQLLHSQEDDAGLL